MNELNMAIYTGKNEENKVTLTASFETHDEAVAFHNGMAELCNKYSRKSESGFTGATRLLGWKKS